MLLDVHLPGGSDASVSGGAEVLRRVAPRYPSTRFLALSVSDKAEDVVGVIRAGARGYITKGASGAEVSRAVQAVAGGDAVFSPRLAGFVLDAFGAAGGETAAADDELDRLSAREQEVMRLIARGYAYKEVAASCSSRRRRSSRTCRACCASCSSRRGTSSPRGRRPAACSDRLSPSEPEPPV